MFIPNPLTHWKTLYDNAFTIMNTREFKGNFNIAKEQLHVFPFYHISNIQMAYWHWHFSFYGWDLHPCKCCHCWFDSCKPFLPRNLYSWFCNAKNSPNGITKLQLPWWPTIYAWDMKSPWYPLLVLISSLENMFQYFFNASLCN